MKSIDMVREFHALFCPQNTLGVGERVQAKVLLTRMQLITEELGEFAMALAANDIVEAFDALTDLQYVLDGTRLATGVVIEPYVTNETCIADKDAFPLRLPEERVRLQMLRDLHAPLSRLAAALYRCHDIRGFMPAAAEPLHDLQYALDDAYLNCGLRRWRWAGIVEVHSSNMSKAGADGKAILSPAGRVVKGPNYRKPDLRRVLGLDSPTFAAAV